MNEIVNSSAIDSLTAIAQENLKETAKMFHDRKTDKNESIETIDKWKETLQKQFGILLYRKIHKNPNLANMRYKHQYEEIVMQSGGKLATLLSGNDIPLVIFGDAFHSKTQY